MLHVTHPSLYTHYAARDATFSGPGEVTSHLVGLSSLVQLVDARVVPDRLAVGGILKSVDLRLQTLYARQGTGLTPADAVIWVIAEVQIGTGAFVPGRYAGQAQPTGRVDVDS